jgi:hypothetical protein
MSIRPPDHIFFSDSAGRALPGEKSEITWRHQGTEVTCLSTSDSLAVDVRAEGSCVRRVRLRWNEPQPANALYLGDHWERGYGDLAWRTCVPERIMPWARWAGLPPARSALQSQQVATALRAAVRSLLRHPELAERSVSPDPSFPNSIWERIPALRYCCGPGPSSIFGFPPGGAVHGRI